MQKLMRIRNVMETVGLARATIYSMVSKGEFPRQVQLGTRSVAWRASEIAAWIDSREKKQHRKEEKK